MTRLYSPEIDGISHVTKIVTNYPLHMSTKLSTFDTIIFTEDIMVKGRRLKNVTLGLDQATGELVPTSKTYSVKVKDTREFFLTFVEVMAPLLKLRSMVDIQVLVQLCILMAYDKNEVVLSAGKRVEVCEVLNMSNSNLSRSLKHLSDLGIISGTLGTYTINPIFFWKGAPDTRDKILRKHGLEFKIKFGGTGGD